MQHENTVENLLQLQLSSDALAVLYLPSILSTLSPIHFSSDAKDSFLTKTGAGAGNANNAASSRVAPMTPALLNKWCTRVTSLMQSKDTGARWAGICLARRTGELRRDVLAEYAQRWINLTLPCLSVRSFLFVWGALSLCGILTGIVGFRGQSRFRFGRRRLIYWSLYLPLRAIFPSSDVRFLHLRFLN